MIHGGRRDVDLDSAGAIDSLQKVIWDWSWEKGCQSRLGVGPKQGRVAVGILHPARSGRTGNFATGKVLASLSGSWLLRFVVYEIKGGKRYEGGKGEKRPQKLREHDS